MEEKHGKTQYWSAKTSDKFINFNDEDIIRFETVEDCQKMIKILCEFGLKTNKDDENTGKTLEQRLRDEFHKSDDYWHAWAKFRTKRLHELRDKRLTEIIIETKDAPIYSYKKLSEL